jgi:hypothetical protein
VYLNGALLQRGIDYVATNGTTITGLAALTNGDLVEVLAFTPLLGGALASTSDPGIVQLSNSISSTSEVLAATPKAVKDAKDDAVSTAASAAASTYLPLAGGTMTGGLAVPSLNGGPLSGARNRILNGAMAVDQRNAGASQTFTAAAALAYSVDRWYGYCTGANVTGQRVQGATAGQFRYQFTGATSVTAIGFGQRIEQLNSADLAETTATLSVDLANSVLTTVTWTAYYATTADTFGTLASPTRTQIATGTFTVNSTVTRYSTNISVPAAATTGIEIVFTVGAQTSGTWTIGDVQLEGGTVATPFERRSYGQELALCQRYYAVTQFYGWNYTPVAGAVRVASVYFPVYMRATPSITFLSVSGNNASGQTAQAPTPHNVGIFTNGLTAGGVNFEGSISASIEL